MTTDSRLQTSFVTCINAIPPSNNYKKNSCRTQYYYGGFIFTFMFSALYQTRQFMGDRPAWSCISFFTSVVDWLYLPMADP